MVSIPVFPTLSGNGFPVKRSPTWLTVRHEATSQKRTYTPKQAFPRWRWKLPYSYLRSAYFGSGALYSELETLVAFFNSRSADGAIFSYADAEQNTAASAPFGTGDATTTAFQLYAAYGGFTEPVYAPTPVNINVNGVPTALYTLNSTGVVTFNVAPPQGAALSWDGTYSFLCRFDDDSLDLERIMRGLHQTGSDLSFSNEMSLS